jgi:hypothetical protein
MAGTRIVLVTIAGLLMVLSIGCATRVVTVSLSTDPSYSWFGSSPGKYKRIFSTSDEKVTLRVVFDMNFVGAIRVFTVEWIGPDGDVYLSEPVRTKWGSNRILFADLYIFEREPSRMPGRWQVRLLYEDRELVSRRFTIE